MDVDWIRTVDPVLEPLTLDEVKKQCDIHQADDNALLGRYLRAARDAAETYLGFGLLSQTVKAQLPQFYDVVYLPMAAPLQSVTSVKYYDTAGVQQTLANTEYVVDIVATPGRVTRAPNKTWPSVQSDRLMPVEIVYVVGKTTAESIPEQIRQGIAVLIAGYEANRIEPAEKAAQALWSPYKVRWIPPRCGLVG